MNLIDRGMAALRSRMAAAHGRTVTYQRPGLSAPVTAWIGTATFTNTLGAAGGRQEWGDRDYLIAVSELAAAGIGEPAEGDRIVETVGGAQLVFEAVVPMNGEPAWRYSDQTRTIVRVHTKRVA